ncbi:hypothetical protein ACFDVB_003522 [Salmonella enterica]|nr:hypothetical protein [Salmonella enterica]
MDSFFTTVALFVNASTTTQVLTLVFLLLILVIVKALRAGG